MLLERQYIAEQGLTNAEAQKRLETAGHNEPAPVQRATLLRQHSCSRSTPDDTLLG
jgi:hypothetical protein